MKRSPLLPLALGLLGAGVTFAAKPEPHLFAAAAFTRPMALIRLR